MRVLWLCLCLITFGCEEINYYGYGVNDGGAQDGETMSKNVGGWTGNFGLAVQLPPEPVIPTTDWNLIQGQRVVDIHTIDGLPRPVAVTLVAPNYDDGPTTGCEIVAVIVWGAGGLSTRAFVDVARGGTINLVASSVQVGVKQMAVLSPVAFPPAIIRTPTVGAFAGPGPGAGNFHPTRTVSWDLPMGALMSLAAPIPPFAKSVRIQGAPMNADLTVTLFSTAGNAILENRVVGLPSGVIPLPNDAYWATTGPLGQIGSYPYLQVFNNGPNAYTGIRCIFELDL